MAGNQGACLHQPAWEVKTQAMGSGEVTGIPGGTPLVPSGPHRNRALWYSLCECSRNKAHIWWACHKISIFSVWRLEGRHRGTAGLHSLWSF